MLTDNLALPFALLSCAVIAVAMTFAKGTVVRRYTEASSSAALQIGGTTNKKKKNRRRKTSS